MDPRDEQDGIAQIDFEFNGDDTPDLMHECFRNQIPGIHRADESCEHDKERDNSDKKDLNKRKEAQEGGQPLRHRARAEAKVEDDAWKVAEAIDKTPSTTTIACVSRSRARCVSCDVQLLHVIRAHGRNIQVVQIQTEVEETASGNQSGLRRKERREDLHDPVHAEEGAERRDAVLLTISDL